MRTVGDMLTSYWYGPIDRRRADLLVRVFSLLFAVDVSVNMLEHGWRYGADGFNVAHFGWLQSIHPVPSSDWYVGCLLASALAAVFAAVRGFGRWPVAVAGICFTYSWAISQLDSYQHHYLFSLVFACLLGVPPTDREHDSEPRAAHARISAWGVPLLCTVVGVVYGFAAFAKTEAGWWNGTIPAQIVGNGQTWVLDLWTAAGGTPEQLWPLMGRSVVLAQSGLALAYLAAPLLQRRDGLWRAAAYAGCALAIGFHTSIETLDLGIGWFSYYMIALALICLGPRAPLIWVSRAGEALGRRVWAPAADRLERADWPSIIGVVAAFGAGWALAKVGLPGAERSALVLGIGTAAGVFGAGLAGRPRLALRLSITALGAALLVLAASRIDQTRFDYFRYAGGDLRRRAPGAEDARQRRQMIERAIDHYQRAEEVSPAGESRREKIERLRRRLDDL